MNNQSSKSDVRKYVNDKFAMLEYKLKYDLSYEEALKRKVLPFFGFGKSRFLRLAAQSYKGTETPVSLHIDEIFDDSHEHPLLRQFEEEAGVLILPTDTIDGIVDKIYASRRAKVLAHVARDVRSWNIKSDELYGDKPESSSIH